MTAARQRRKSCTAAFLGLWLAVCAGSLAAFAVTDETVVVNADTGLAISGFDPVAYFTDHRARIGRPDLELRAEGAIWRFENPGNKAAFAMHPEVYTPRFGGHDPVAIARGASVPGHPLFWAVVGDRLYLFYSADARATFLTDPGRFIAAAGRKWPELAHSAGR
jgi:hypothetical protein